MSAAEPHLHAIAGGVRQPGCDLAAVHHIQDYRKAIRDLSDAHPRAARIQGSGWYGGAVRGREAGARRRLKRAAARL
jgi:predicted amidohydrolase YtcJ